MTKKIYQNLSNPNKYIEVKHYSDGHYYALQYIAFLRPYGGHDLVKNFMGGRRQRFYRMSLRTQRGFLFEDYREVDDAEVIRQARANLEARFPNRCR